MNYMTGHDLTNNKTTEEGTVGAPSCSLTIDLEQEICIKMLMKKKCP
jgi:hypothetical protein